MRKFLLLLLVAIAVNISASAQQIKFGRINSQEIIDLMPETDSATTKINARANLLQEQIKFMQDELRTKYAAFQKESETVSRVIADQRQKDIVDLNAKLEQFTYDAEQEIGAIKNALTQPIFKKFQDAIEKVSKVNLITFVVDEAQPGFIYMDNSALKDLTPLMKQELKLKDKKPAPTATR